MGERFAVVSEEDINLLVEKALPENTKKSTSYAVNVFDGKLLVNVSFNIVNINNYNCCEISAQFLLVCTMT